MYYLEGAIFCKEAQHPESRKSKKESRQRLKEREESEREDSEANNNVRPQR